MDEDGSLPTTAFSALSAKKEASDSRLLGRGRYKFLALAAILLLACWSMFTGTISLRWSAGNLDPMYDNLDILIDDDIDVLVSSFLQSFPVNMVGTWSKFGYHEILLIAEHKLFQFDGLLLSLSACSSPSLTSNLILSTD